MGLAGGVHHFLPPFVCLGAEAAGRTTGSFCGTNIDSIPKISHREEMEPLEGGKWGENGGEAKGGTQALEHRAVGGSPQGHNGALGANKMSGQNGELLAEHE